MSVDLSFLILPKTDEDRIAEWREKASMSVATFESSMRAQGLWDGVEAIAATLEPGSEPEILWRRATVVDRASPLWVAFAPTLGLSDDDIDQMAGWTPVVPVLA